MSGGGNVRFLVAVDESIEQIGLKRIYLWFMLLFGTAICFLTPPYQVMDEEAHFRRAWQLADGTLVSPALTTREIFHGNNPCSTDIINAGVRIGLQNGGPGMTEEFMNRKFLVAELPMSLVSKHFTGLHVGSAEPYYSWDQCKNFLFLPREGGETEWVIIPNTGMYSPLSYLPQSVGGLLAKLLSLPLGITFYLMRFAAMLFVMLCVYFSFRLFPEKRHLIFVLATMPMFLLETASVSVDAVMYGVCLLGSAWLLSLRNRDSLLSDREIVALFALAIVIGLIKPSYGTILLLYFLLPIKCLKNALCYLCVGVGILLASLAATSVWMDVAVRSQGVPITFWDIPYPQIDAERQKRFICDNPIATLTAGMNTIQDTDGWRMKSFVGMFGNYDMERSEYLPDWQYVLYMAIIVTLALHGAIRLKFLHRLILLFALAVTAVGLFVIEYIIWTPVGAEMISGVQGRYFIPVALLLFVPLSCNLTFRYANILAVAGGLYGGIITLWYTCTVFY